MRNLFVVYFRPMDDFVVSCVLCWCCEIRDMELYLRRCVGTGSCGRVMLFRRWEI